LNKLAPGGSKPFTAASQSFSARLHRHRRNPARIGTFGAIHHRFDESHALQPVMGKRDVAANGIRSRPDETGFATKIADFLYGNKISRISAWTDLLMRMRGQ
jgi:hypothetical protein